MNQQELFDKLTDAQKEKFKNCKNTEELTKLLAEEGIELADEQLAQIAGGGCFDQCGH